jgi:membrane protease YdiL (CAAX protease family)
MVLWFASFLLVGHVGLPSAVQWLGFNCRELSARGLALYSLSADVVEMFVGLGVLFQCLRPYFTLPRGWFPARLSFRGGWWKEVALGCSVFPIVSTLNNLNSSMMPTPSTSLPVSPWEQSLLSNDLVSICFYIAVVSLVAPVWEEFIFRGFLLPSFTRYFRADVSILLSSLIFALAHFSIERLIPLTFLGMLMCVVYLRSKNILAPIILHSLWNAFAFVELVVKPEAAATWITNLFGMGV